MWRFLLFFPLWLCAKPLEVDVEALSALLMNAESGAILFEKQAHEPRFPASVTKVATALYILEEGGMDPSTRAVASREALRKKPLRGQALPYLLDPEGSEIGLGVGDILTVEELLHGMLISSGNDAANVLAERIGGTIPLFVDRMNAYLRGLGCCNTQFANPHGLHDEDHRTTAYDLALMTRRALNHALFRTIIGKVSWRGPSGKELMQTNRLMRPGKFYDRRVIGGKTGFTSDAGYSLVAVAEVEGRRLIAVVLGAQSSEARFRGAQTLFDAAFAEARVTHPLFAKGQLFERPIEGGTQPLRAQLEAGLSLEYYPAEEPHVRAVAHWTLPQLPIAAGAIVGEIRILGADQQILVKAPLVATQAVEETWTHMLERLWHVIW